MKIKRKEIIALTVTQKNDASCMGNRRGMNKRAKRNSAKKLRHLSKKCMWMMFEFRKFLVKTENQLPKTRHWAVLVFCSHNVHHEGDERSRTNPGHGYPAYDETINSTDYYAFLEKQSWEDCIRQIESSNTSNRQKVVYAAIEVAGAAVVKTKIEVSTAF